MTGKQKCLKKNNFQGEYNTKKVINWCENGDKIKISFTSGKT